MADVDYTSLRRRLRRALRMDISVASVVAMELSRAGRERREIGLSLLVAMLRMPDAYRVLDTRPRIIDVRRGLVVVAWK